jgi:hypothetical protein
VALTLVFIMIHPVLAAACNVLPKKGARFVSYAWQHMCLRPSNATPPAPCCRNAGDAWARLNLLSLDERPAGWEVSGSGPG